MSQRKIKRAGRKRWHSRRKQQKDGGKRQIGERERDSLEKNIFVPVWL